MQPLKVTFKLAGYIGEPSQPLHFDGLIAWVIAERALNAGRDPADATRRLPFASVEMKGEKIWCASALVFRKNGVDQRHMIRRSDPVAFMEAVNSDAVDLGRRNPKRFDNSRGEYKQYSLYYSLLKTEEATAWCVGEKTSLKGLLGDLTHIGKLRRLGHGRVLAVDVVQDREADEKWRLRDLPLEEPASDYVPVVATVRPPYWDATTRRACYRPRAFF